MSVPKVFKWPYGGHKVQLVGNFSKWNPIIMENKNGTFQIVQDLPLGGIYYYKFIVDGRWCYDQGKPNCDDNHGSKNNVLNLGAEKEKSDTQLSKQKNNHQQQQQKKTPQKFSKRDKSNTLNINKIQNPNFWEERLTLWEEIKRTQQQQQKNSGVEPISITLPDGSLKEGVAGVTTPMDIAQSISAGLAQNAIVAKVDDVLYDLLRPLEKSCSLSIFKFDSPEGKKVFWHSSAHIMGQALERIFNCSLCVGPPLDNGGFYYDMATQIDSEGYAESFEQDHCDLVQQLVVKITKEKQPFERLVLSKQEAIQLFKYNKYKVELISDKVPDGGICTAYRCGPLIDLCKGPHVPHTGKIKAFEVWKNASAYWKGDSNNDTLQRVYGISFPDPKLLTEWKKNLELAKERDHRVQGLKQELIMFHPLSPGCAFFLPRGVRVYNRLVDFIRSEYRKRGFTEVISPNMFNKDLWITSGHWANYKDDMFTLDVEGQEFALKPMNCPGHCLMYQHTKRSYKDLPIRFADFGVLHRNELSGALTGLTRVRRFCQDDAHIFCRPDQIGTEIKGCFDFLKHVYDIFGWRFTLELSTRPEKKYIGDIETWNSAENTLAECLNEFVGKGGWKLNPGDGAFYGPKIDIHVFDVLQREHQLATIQLDFNLPSANNFDLSFVKDDDTLGRPVMIHRAVLGSLERYMAILIENTAGKWPFWLSPRPCIICTFASQFEDYAKKVRDELFQAGFDTDLDVSDHTVPKKIAMCQTSGYNYILVVGQVEMLDGVVDVRLNNERRKSTVPELIREWRELITQYK